MPDRAAGPQNLDRGMAQVLVEFAHTLGTDFSLQKILDHLVLRVVDLLSVTGAGVMLMGEREELHFVAASNEVVLRIEGLQNELQEGPCLQAYRSGQPVTIPDLQTDTRFTKFSPRALESGMAAVFTFPLRLETARLGALDLYRDTPGQLDGADLHAAQVLADVAAAYLFNAQSRIDASAAIARLNRHSLHDPLTGLANRTLLEELLAQAVARARRSHRVAAVLYADLDGFKRVNDSYGHLVGDQLLTAAAKRLTEALRPGDTLARLGGDEFVVLCEDLNDRADAEKVARRMTEEMSRPFLLSGHRVVLSASIGIAYSGPGQDIPEVLLRDADFAMYQVKTLGGGHHQVLDPAARFAADRREDLERDLHQAQTRGQLSLVYQPIVDMHTLEVVSVEALLRWLHPERGPVPPDVTIPSAERTGLILDLGEWVLRQACQQLVQWQHDGVPLRHVAVNVSAHQVMGAGFARTVQQVLAETGAPAAGLCLEVTETVVLADAARALTVLREVRDLGVTWSLDDFGTGYSSLSYLRQLPVDVVKIDQSFTANLPTDRVTRAIVRAVIDLAHVLDLTVVAEGVETAGEFDELCSLGADRAQGFHLSQPLTPGQLADGCMPLARR